jgi:hypothetical protein
MSWQRDVVYADLEEREARDQFVAVCHQIRQVLQTHSIPMVQTDGFVPHLTLMKTSKGME